jgi:hypothetical protein
MDILQAEIARKRKASEEATSAALGGNVVEGKKKWVKKGDLERVRAAK